jgi:carboxypeptidase Taq
MGTVHETGHGRYEQNLPRAWLGQPVAEARSMAMHESQSLSFEMQLGSHPGFVNRLGRRWWLQFGDQPAFAPATLEADDAREARLHPRRRRRGDLPGTRHPALRDRAPADRGRIEPEDVPALWDAKMMELLGLDTRGNFKDGPLQDVHWPEGLFGYFPCYSLGAMYAAQWPPPCAAPCPTWTRASARATSRRVRLAA